MVRRARPERAGAGDLTHLSEERDIQATPEELWRVITNTQLWPRFYATPKETLHLRSVEFIDGTTRDELGARRRMHFLGVPAWDEEISAWRENEFVAWMGVRNPGLKYWQQQIEIIPGKVPNASADASGSSAQAPAVYTTLRWDVYFSMGGPRAFRKWFKRTMEEIVLSSLERVEKIAREKDGG